ncbi:MAG: SIMPL domain-containing protein [Chloroflexi bacterium]|nr:SIMPL domain-containing protein [Chloroflexota bacterium]
MQRHIKSIALFGLLIALVSAFVAPVAAQDMPANTITVFGSAEAAGTPDQATLELGVDTFTTSVSEAFDASNETVRTIVAEIVALGVAEEDIQTANLSVYSTTRYTPETGDQQGYQVSNTVRVLVRNVDLVDDIINTGIENGATSLYGLYFSVSDPAPLETIAREGAVAQARARAEALASLLGVQLGEVVSVREDFGGSVPVFYAGMERAQGGGGGAYVAPGQTSVTVNVTLTFELVR